MDAAIFNAMESAGVVSRGTHTPKAGGQATPVRFYLDNPEQDQLGGEANSGGVVSTVNQVSIFRSDVESPKQGDRIAEESGTTYDLTNRVREDASLSIWRARRG
jgi:hypothetical protein